MLLTSRLQPDMEQRKLIIADVVLVILGVVLIVVGGALFPFFDRKIKDTVEKVGTQRFVNLMLCGNCYC